MAEAVDVLVIGASAAGLATAACLQKRGREATLLEAADQVGSEWRGRYDRLHLHTPKSVSALPGLQMPRTWPRYPSRDQVVDYLERYAATYGLRPRFGERVTSLDRQDGAWVASSTSTTWQAQHVVVATGAARRPVLPSWPGMEQYRGQVLHSCAYRSGEPWRGGRVLVVGFGNSGCEQAIDLLEHGAEPHLAVRSPVNVIPRDLLGIPVVRVGIATRRLPPRVADALSWPLLRLTVGDYSETGLQQLPYGPNVQIVRKHRIPLLDVETLSHIRAGRIQVHSGIEAFTGGGVRFDDGTSLDVDAVVLATGYRPALEDFLVPWREVCDDAGAPVVSGDVTSIPGLHFCGQHVVPSGMLREIGLEARRIARSIAPGRQVARSAR